MTVAAKKSDLVARGYSAAWWHMSLQGGLLLLLLITAPNIPRLDAVLLFLLGVVSLFYFLAVEKGLAGALKGPEERWLLTVIFGLSGYLFLNAFWAEDLSTALNKAVFFLLMILVVLLASRSFTRQSGESLERTAKLIVWGFVIGTVFACFEFSTGHYLERMLYTAWPAIRPSEKAIDVFISVYGELVQLAESEFHKDYDNVVIQVSSSALNRNLSLLVLLVWPVLFLAAHQKDRRIRLAAIALIGSASAGSILMGLSQTAQIALVVSALVYLATRMWPRAVHWSVLGAWCVVVVLAVPLAGAPHKAGLHKAEWLFDSARARIVIWSNIAERVSNAPILGTGIRSSRIINKKLKKKGEMIFDQDGHRRLALHPHNHFLQIWFELGALGAAFILAAGIGILQRMRRLGANQKPYAYATFVAACLIAAFGWGLWQTWLLSGYALSIIFMAFAIEFSKRRAQSAPAASV